MCHRLAHSQTTPRTSPSCWVAHVEVHHPRCTALCSPPQASAAPARPGSGPRTKAAAQGQQPRLRLLLQGPAGRQVAALSVAPHTSVSRIVEGLEARLGPEGLAESLGLAATGRSYHPGSLVCSHLGRQLEEWETVKRLGLRSGDALQLAAAPPQALRGPAAV